MRHARPIATAAAVVAAAALGITPAHAATDLGGGAFDPSLLRVNILNINDFHGRIETDAYGNNPGKNLACTVVEQRAALGADSTIFLGDGDMIGASQFTSAIQGDVPTLNFLDALGMSASAVGNHEFDKGYADLAGQVSDAAKFEYLGANVYLKGTTTPALPEYKIVDVSGVKVGIIGAVTGDLPTLVDGAGIATIDVGDPVAAVNRVADQLTDTITTNGEADVLIAEIHDGAPYNSKDATLDAQLTSQVFSHIVNDTSAKVAAIFNGHTHALYAYSTQVPGAPAGSTRAVAEAQNYGAYVAKLELGVDPTTKAVKAYNVSNVKAIAPNPTCEADATYQTAVKVIDDAIAYAAPLAAEKVGEVTADITRGQNAGKEDRGVESTLGNLISQQYLESVNATGRVHADLALNNPGGIRADLLYGEDGVITFAEAAAIMPFGNTLKTADFTGAQVKQILEEQWQPAGASRPFLALGSSSNVRWTYDPTAAAGSRITGVWIDGTPLDPKATYTIASNSFLLTTIGSPDNFTTFTQGTNYVDTGLVDQNAFVDWVKANSPISPSYVKHAVAVINPPATLTIDTQSPAFLVDGIDINSLGAPANTRLDIYVGDRKAGTAKVTTTETLTPVPRRTGSATVTFWVKGAFLNDAIKAAGLKPGTRSATTTIKLVAAPTGTVVTIPVTVAKPNVK